MRDRRFAVKLLALLIGLACWRLVGLGVSGWGAVVSGQTVPRTPPPTWTRTPRATATRTPTGAPTVPPTATFTLVPGAPTATFTLAPDAPTAVPQPQLWIALAAQPEVVGPGDSVQLVCRIGNRGGAFAGRMVITLPVGAPLLLEQASSDRGVSRAEAGIATWTLEALEPGAEAILTAQARVSLKATPGQEVTLQARLAAENGELASDPVIITLPWALLPATGG